MFKKIMASLGKGAATVDLVLHSNECHQGDSIQGEVIVKGGSVTQEINEIAVGLFISLNKTDGAVFVEKIDTVHVCSGFIINPNETKRFDFQYRLQTTLPISSSKVSYYFDTHLDIDKGRDKNDYDYISVLPSKELSNVIEAFQSLGFYPKQSFGKLKAEGQEFEFAPNHHSAIEEIEMYVAHSENGMYLNLEIDLYGFLGEIEKRDTLYLSYEVLNNLDEVIAILDGWIQAKAQNNSYNSPYLVTDRHLAYNQFNLHKQHSSFSSRFGTVGGVVTGLVAGYFAGEVIEELIEDGLSEEFASAFEGEEEEEFEEMLDDFFESEDD